MSVLLIALADATGVVSDITAHRKYRHRTKQNALAWVAATSRKPFSFHWICEHLGLDPFLVREKLSDENYEMIRVQFNNATSR